MIKSQHITGATRLCALIGHPLGHSLSPLIHNHAFASLSLPYAYIPLPVAPEKLPAVFDAMRAAGFIGANITIPHKQAALGFCTELSELSRITQTVNTIKIESDRIYGTTTDTDGFLRALASQNIEPRGKKITILGNGGTARTLALALCHLQIPAALTLVGRSRDKVEKLADEIRLIARCGVSARTFDCSQLTEALHDQQIIVNCTSVGMHPHAGVSPLAADHLPAAAFVFDAIYNPAETELLRFAKVKGCKTQNGLRMLLFQALASFKIWTGIEVAETLFDIDELQQYIHKPAPE